MSLFDPQKNQVNSTWNILIIDDDEDDYLLTRAMLAEAQVRKVSVKWASNFQAGREELLKDHYHAVLVDYDLGDHTGLDIIREASERDYSSPLILFTGRGSIDVDIEAMQAGATMYLTKSEVNPLLLERAIRYAIQLKQREQDLRLTTIRLEEELIERKNAEEALRFSEERFHKAFNASPNAHVISRQVDGLIQAVNEGFEQLFGYHRDEVLGKTSLELNMFANASDRQTAVRKLQEHNSLRGFEMDIRTKFGEIRQAKLSVEVIELNSEKFMLTVLEDITDRRRVETALRESEERHRVAIMNAPAIYSQMDRDLRYIWIHNPPPDFEGSDVLGKRDDELEDNEDTRHLVELKRKVIESGVGVRKEVQYHRSDGIHFYDITLEPLRGADGQITGISSAAFDITDLKRAEEALHANELTFRNLADAMPQLVWTARPDGSVDYYNQRYQEYDGIGPASYSNWMWAPVLHPDDIFATITAWEHAIKTGTIYQIEHRVRMADGGYCWHLSRGVPAKDSEGNVIKWYGTATNIHEQKEAEEKLKRSNQQLEQFAFIASHDLQEPLRKIRAFGNLLEKESGDHLIGESADHLKRVIQAAERMQMMINSMLELSRVTTHGGAYIPVDLNKIAQEVMSDLETPIRKMQAMVQVGELPVIEANPVQMRQLLQNLIANAIKFHQDDLPPRVNLTGKIESLPAGVQMMAVLAIEDNGIGFEEREFERILQPFQRLHHHNKYEGMGMGLPICARIVERHGGKLEVKSQVGQGTTFYVTLPVIQEG